MLSSQHVRRKGRPSKHETDSIYFAPRTSAGMSDCAVYVSEDGRRQTNIVGSPQKKQCVERNFESDLVEQWESHESWDPGCGEGGLEDESCHEVISTVVVDATPEKAKCYMNSVSPQSFSRILPADFMQDMPMLSWKEHTTEFLQEMLCHEALFNTTCDTCQCTPTHPHRGSMDPPPHLIRCKDCYGGFVECVDCSVKRHGSLPLHNLQVCSNIMQKNVYTE